MTNSNQHYELYPQGNTIQSSRRRGTDPESPRFINAAIQSASAEKQIMHDTLSRLPIRTYLLPRLKSSYQFPLQDII